MREFTVSEFITLRLEGKDTIIYIAGNRFQQCKYLFLNIPADDLELFDDIESIDEAAEELDKSIEPKHNRYVNIPKEVEFWAHCSNIQAFYENNYDTRILHSNLAFPLLRKLYEVGDPLAKKVLKDEIAKRFSGTHRNSILFLLENNYQFYLTPSEFNSIYQDLALDKQELIKRFLHDKFDGKKSDNEFKNKLFDYLEVICSKQELDNFQYVIYKEERFFLEVGALILNNIEKISAIKGLNKLTGLKRLCFRHSQIASIEELKHLETLELLDLSQNRLKLINGLSTLKNLKVLDLSYNEIDKITGLEDLEHLEELNLRRNIIKEISGVESILNLKTLYLDSNLIEKIENLDALRDLEYFSLSQNNISKIEGLNNLKNLHHLILSENRITEIKGLEELYELRSLILDRNRISEIRGLENLNQLNSLDLGHNRISEIKGLEKLYKLKSLELENNQIKEIKSLEGLRNLHEINLQDNQIYKIHEIEGYMNLEYINLKENKLLGNLNRDYEGFRDIEKLFYDYRKLYYL